MIGVDVGNTKIHCFWGNQAAITKERSILAKNITLSKLQRLLGKAREPVVVCSVVPRITKLFEQLREKYSIVIVGKDIQVPVRCLYDKQQVGMDRLVAAYAARKLYPRTRIVVDCGTAITIDFLSARGDYQGGFILPGIGSTLDVFSSCAMLPKKIVSSKTRSVIPKNTNESINRGIAEGFSGMIDTFVKRYKRLLHISSSSPLVITGGDAARILSYFKFSYYYEPELVGRGLFLVGQP